MLKVLIAEDMKILRDSLKLTIEINSSFEVIGTACDGAEAVEMCQRLKPDLVLMDIMMPYMNGFEATKQIKMDFPDIKILILTSMNDRDDIIKAIDNGADGYVHKDISGKELILAIQGVQMGLNFVHRNAFHTHNAGLHNDNPLESSSHRNEVALTNREFSVIELLANGMTNEEISSILNISVGRVRNIVTTLISKLMLKNRTQLAVYAVKHYQK